MIFEEFRVYKESSADDEHAAPTRHVQENYCCIVPLFGRDRFDKENRDARSEDIQHLHIREDHSIWEDEEGLLSQWYCTSDRYLVYSYFLHEGIHHYYIIELYNSSSHLQYVEDVRSFVEDAKAYRLEVINGKEKE